MPKFSFPLALFICLLIPGINQAKQKSAKVNLDQLSQLVLDDVKLSTLSLADQMIHEKPVTVTAATSKLSAGGHHDFFSQADYFWPDPADPKAPFIQKDGQSYPGLFSEHRRAMIRMSDITATLTSAWMLTGKKKYALAAS